MLSERWTIASVPGREVAVADALIRCMRAFVVSESRLAEIRTAVTEACLNAMEHGNGFDARKSVSVVLRADEASATVRVRDEGPGPAAEQLAGPGADPQDIWRKEQPRGWGLALIRAFADGVDAGSDAFGSYVDLHFHLIDS